MKIHHLNCGTMRAFGFPREDGTGGFLQRGYGVIHCLLVHTGDGLALVDTGWGMRDCTDPTPAVKQFMGIIHCPRDPNETALRQVEKLGYDPAEVKHIFMTHLHLDHAGGLPDFPTAEVHVLAEELQAHTHPRTLMEWRAYRPEHRAHGPRWQTHPLGGDQWFGLDSVPPIRVGEAEFVMVPLTGHTRGHCAIAVRTGERWLLHCGDAYGYYRQAGVEPYTHPSGRIVEWITTTGFNIPRQHWARIRELLRAHGDEIRAFCTHDAHELKLCD